MAEKKIGLSRDLIIHPGETIADILEERNITQAELAIRTGVTPTYISNVVSGKKDISANFARKLEYALGIEKLFWLNLQANYDSELLEYNENNTVRSEELEIITRIKEIVNYLKKVKLIPNNKNSSDDVISLRALFQISDLCNLKELVPSGAFRISNTTTIEPYVMGAWLSLCRVLNCKKTISTSFNKECIDELILELKSIMINPSVDFPVDIARIMEKYGIVFSILRNFKGAPVHGYIFLSADMVYHMSLTIRGSFADIFWFSLFHELGHIFNDDIIVEQKYIDLDVKSTERRELAADEFAKNRLINPNDYKDFIAENDFSLRSIILFAKTQNVMPYIVIGRLQKEKRIPYSWYNDQKIRYKWSS